MTGLSPTGARILDVNDDGTIHGHPAALAKLEGDCLVIPHSHEGGAHWMAEEGWTALEARRAERTPSAAQARTCRRSRLPVKQHEAISTAAQRPDQLVAGRNDRAYWKGERWFNGRTFAGGLPRQAHKGAASLFDADVIFLDGRDYAYLVRPFVPHLLTPLTGGVRE
ncbi:hypothetical protein [Streptomyces halstedii]|uniref:hypothetical protein n=1 Tax=Streptomyces halstedii TaxID=1944 RepID=UPI001942D69B|nr:hypothetical protein [Streptomyces halstedii]